MEKVLLRKVVQDLLQWKNDMLNGEGGFFARAVTDEGLVVYKKPFCCYYLKPYDCDAGADKVGQAST